MLRYLQENPPSESDIETHDLRTKAKRLNITSSTNSLQGASNATVQTEHLRELEAEEGVQ